MLCRFHDGRSSEISMEEVAKAAVMCQYLVSSLKTPSGQIEVQLGQTEFQLYQSKSHLVVDLAELDKRPNL